MRRTRIWYDYYLDDQDHDSRPDTYIQLYTEQEWIYHHLCAHHIALKTIDLSPVWPVKHISDNMLLMCESIRSIDTSALTNVETICYNFLDHCVSLRNIDLSGFTRLTKFNYEFLSCAYSLRHVDMSQLTSLVEIGNHFLLGCSRLETLILPRGIKKIGSGFLFSSNIKYFDMSVLASVEEIGAGFMFECSWTYIDLRSLENIRTIGGYFLTGTELITVDLPDFKHLEKIGRNFMSNNRNLQNIDITKLSHFLTLGLECFQNCPHI